MTRSLMTAALAAAIGLSAASTARAADISGAGATFPFPIYSKWAAEYKKLTGDGLNYQSIGSGAGIKQIQAKTVVFGATDAPLKGEDLAKDGLVQFPMVMGGVVPVVNVEGLKPGELILDGATFAKIYLGEIKSWDDPALKKLNPSLNLPKQAIAPVYRSDGSGTTFLFTNYLAKVSPDFAKKVGAATSVKWPVGIGGKGNEGVAATVTQAKGAIGYVEYAYAKVNKMAHAGLINKAGKPVQPSLATFQAAAANADWSSAPGFGVILTEQPGEASWPITGATFILVHERPANPAGVTTALKFFAWALEKGQPMAEALDYVPLPPKVVADIETSWSKIVGPDGKPVWSK